MMISLLLWLPFFHCSKSNEEEDFRKAIQFYKNTVGVNCRHDTSNQKGNQRSKISWSSDWYATLQAVNCVVWDSWAVGKERWLEEFYFGVCRFGFHWFRADSNVYDGQKSWNCFFRHRFSMGSLSSYELFTFPRLDGVIHNSWFSYSKYSLLIFF